jgi:hypothetical protein
MIDTNDILTGPFSLKYAKEHLLPDEAIVTNDNENYYIIRLHDYEKLKAMQFRKV